MDKLSIKSSISKWTFEFFLIVIGVTIALWLENVAEENKEREIEQAYMLSFQDDISKDIIRLKSNIKNNVEIVKQVEVFLDKMMANQITVDNMMSEVAIMMNYDFFTPDDFTLSSIRASGDFRLLKDPQVKHGILRLKRAYDHIEVLQQNFQKALDSEIVPMFIENIDMTRGKVVNPDFIRDHRLANIVGYTISDLNGRVASYRRTLEKAESINQLLISKAQ